MKGTIKWYNPMKGFGFIQGEDGKDVYPDDPVEYTVEESEKGLKATNVKIC